MYSGDRKDQLLLTVDFLKKMHLYEECQKTLVVDGKNNVIIEDFEIIQVARKNGNFCWGRMWDAGVATANFEKIVYLDSDRLLPSSFLQKLEKVVEDDVFAFTSRHFMVIEDRLNAAQYEEILESPDLEALSNPEYNGCLFFEPRFEQPVHGPGKNVMSGSVSFTKTTYNRLGGVDHWYCGHGAYADTDFHLQAARGGCRFIDLKLAELHCHHNKLKDDETLLTKEELHRLSDENFQYYLSKWELPNGIIYPTSSVS